MSSNKPIESKEPNKEEIKNILKRNTITIFNQIKKGCKHKTCYNIYCANNLICKNSKLFFYIYFNYYRIRLNSK